MMAGLTADRRCALVACLLTGCFIDNGLQTTSQADAGTGTTGGATDATATTTDATATATTGAPTTTGASATTSTGEPAPVCGDSVIEAPVEECDDGNLDDADACLSTCKQASCGDGVLWAGVEECDDGPKNSHEPGACRPDCQLPACGDGGLYVGPLGQPIVLPAVGDTLSQGNDAPRSIAAHGSDQFSVLWRSDATVDQLPLQRLGSDGALLGVPTNYQTQQTPDVRDPVVAVAPNGDTAVFWETADDILFSARVGGGTPKSADITTLNGSFYSPQAGAGPANQVAVAFLGDVGGGVLSVFVRTIPDLAAPGGAPPEQRISDHLAGEATPPVVAFDPSGAFLVAWGDPSGQVLYRRFDVGGKPKAIVTTDLTIDLNNGPVWSPWTGATLQATDAGAVVTGRDGGGHFALQRFDAGDVAQATVQVDEQDPRFVQFADLASDPWGNLAVVWNACGTSKDVGATNCNNLPQRWSIRWFYPDLDPLGPSAQLFDAGATLTPVSVAMTSAGVTAVTYAEGNQVKVRIAGLACP